MGKLHLVTCQRGTRLPSCASTFRTEGQSASSYHRIAFHRDFARGEGQLANALPTFYQLDGWLAKWPACGLTRLIALCVADYRACWVMYFGGGRG